MNATLLGLVAALSSLSVLLQGQTPTPRPKTVAERAKPAHYQIPLGWEPHVISVKFRDGLAIRLRNGVLTDVGNTGALDQAAAVLEQVRAGTWSRTHAVAEAELDRLRALGEENVGFALHDLNLLFRCHLPADVDAAAIIDAWNALDCVERAESVPGMAPPPQAPDLRCKQGYSEPAPRGTGAGPCQGLPDNNNPFANLGGSGGHARIVDIEYGFDALHADLPPIGMLTAPGYSIPAWDEHGTAVLGLLGSANDGKGTTGMAHAAQLMFARAFTPAGIYDIDNSIMVAASAIGPGGVILIEQQIAGPHWVGPPPSQVGLVPVEWYPPTWWAIQNAVAAGLVVVEAAGNGSEDLDHVDYAGWFSAAHDSGALLVGAGAAPPPSAPVPPSPPFARSRMSFSNYGETLDLQGWGEKVTTTGYGDAYSAGGPHQTYTHIFGGTSSASAVIAGVCALVQSLHFDRRSFYLNPTDLRAALRRSGTPQAGAPFVADNIGPLPDILRTAVELRLYGGLGFAHGFGQSLLGSGGNGLEINGFEKVTAMAEFDDDGPGSNPTRLYVAGGFSRIGRRLCNNIACWNGVGWEELAQGVGGYLMPASALAVHDADGPGPGLPRLYAGGYFAQGIQSWNGISWSSVGGGCGGALPFVHSFTVIDEDGPGPLGASLIVGGDFTSVGGIPAQRVARWRNGGWSPLGSGFDGRVAVLEAYDADGDGPGLPRIVAGGDFQNTGSGSPNPLPHLAIWNGGVWSALGGGTNATVTALESVPMTNQCANTGQMLFVGGSFSDCGGVPVAANGLAVWNGANWFMPYMPWSAPQQPNAIVSFEDGSEPTLPRQRDVYLSAAPGLYRLDLTTWVPTQLAQQTVLINNPLACLMVFDEDGAGVEPPSVVFGDAQFTGPTPSTGIAKVFGMTPTTLTGYVLIAATGCGGAYQPTIATTSEPVLGQPFTVQFDSLPQSLPVLLVGAPQPGLVPLCSSQTTCALGVQPDMILLGASATFLVPCDLGLLGATAAVQGIEINALPHGTLCTPPFVPFPLRATDTLLVTF